MINPEKFEGTWQTSNGENLVFFLLKYIDSNVAADLHAFRNIIFNRDKSLPPRIMISNWPDLTNVVKYKPKQKDYREVIKLVWKDL